MKKEKGTKQTSVIIHQQKILVLPFYRVIHFIATFILRIYECDKLHLQ